MLTLLHHTITTIMHMETPYPNSNEKNLVKTTSPLSRISSSLKIAFRSEKTAWISLQLESNFRSISGSSMEMEMAMALVVISRQRQSIRVLPRKVSLIYQRQILFSNSKAERSTEKSILQRRQHLY